MWYMIIIIGTSLTCLIKGSFEGHEYEEVPLSSESLSEETVLTRSLTKDILPTGAPQVRVSRIRDGPCWQG